MSHIHALTGPVQTLREFAQRGRVLAQTVTDINEPQSSSEVFVALWSAFAQYGLESIGTNNVHFAIGAYRVDQAAMETQKRLFPLDTLKYPFSITIVNVAEIAESNGGRRKDHVWVAVTKSGRIAVGYTTQRSPILDLILPGLSALWEFNTPRSWDEGRHFRTRDVLTRLCGGLLAQSPDVLELLRPVPLANARTHFSIRSYNPSAAWWADSIGWSPYNIKTGFDENHPVVRKLEPGDRVRVKFGRDGQEHIATYAHSLQSSGQPGGLVFTHASSGYCYGDGGPVHYLDIMKYGGNAWRTLGCPEETDELIIEPVVALCRAKPEAVSA